MHIKAKYLNFENHRKISNDLQRYFKPDLASKPVDLSLTRIRSVHTYITILESIYVVTNQPGLQTVRIG